MLSENQIEFRNFVRSLPGCNAADRREEIGRGRWDELCPSGARRFYEGDDPDGFRAEMWQEFGFDVAADDPEVRPGGWTEERGWAFTIPMGLVGKIYGSGRWSIGS